MGNGSAHESSHHKQRNGRPVGIAWRSLSTVRPLSTTHAHIA